MGRQDIHTRWAFKGREGCRFPLHCRMGVAGRSGITRSRTKGGGVKTKARRHFQASKTKDVCVTKGGSSAKGWWLV